MNSGSFQTKTATVSLSRVEETKVKYKITHQTKYAYSESVPVCHNLVHLAPRSSPLQDCEEFRLLIHPEPHEINQRYDYFGNLASFFSIDQAHLGLTVTATSRVKVAAGSNVEPRETPPWEQVASELRTARTTPTLNASQFVFDSPRIKTFKDLADFARPSFAAGRPILDAVLDLTTRIYEEFKFDALATTVHTPLEDVLANRHGVCQDFAQLQIGCLRSLGLAARYVSGYLRTEPPPGQPRLVGADASHAWLSVYLGEPGWIDVDPTNNVIVGTDHVTVAWGRDYQDVCPIQGIIVGGGEHKMNVSVDVELSA